jgi:hypothetical protein
MKIENLKLIDFDQVNYSKDVFVFLDKEYPGALSNDAFIEIDGTDSVVKDAVTFSIDNLTIRNNCLYGTFRLVNSKGSELMAFFNSFKIAPVLNTIYDDEIDSIIKVELVGFTSIFQFDLS